MGLWNLCNKIYEEIRILVKGKYKLKYFKDRWCIIERKSGNIYKDTPYSKISEKNKAYYYCQYENWMALEER